MNENRRQVLEMLAAGKITADEAERLIAALEKEPPSAAGSQGAESGTKPRPKYLRVLVDADENGHGHGPVKANIRVPMQLLRAGVKLASLIPAPARDHVNEAFRERGMQVDLTQIKPENLEELIDQLNDLTIDVDVDKVDSKDQKVKVRVFCE